MKTKIALITAVVVLGVWLGTHLMREQIVATRVKQALIADTDPVPAAPAIKPQPAVTSPQAKPAPEQQKSTPSSPQRETASIAPAEAPVTDATAHLRLSDENVSEMERHRDQLKDYAYTVKTGEGWKIQILPEDLVFMKAGLNSGDIITFESMDDQLQKPDRAELATRMVAILNSIER